MEIWVWVSRSITVNEAFGSYGQPRFWFQDAKQKLRLLFLWSDFEFFVWDVDWRDQAYSFWEKNFESQVNSVGQKDKHFFCKFGLSELLSRGKNSFQTAFSPHMWSLKLWFWWRKPNPWLQRRSPLIPDWQGTFCKFWDFWNVAKLIQKFKWKIT